MDMTAWNIGKTHKTLGIHQEPEESDQRFSKSGRFLSLRDYTDFHELPRDDGLIRIAVGNLLDKGFVEEKKARTRGNGIVERLGLVKIFVGGSAGG